VLGKTLGRYEILDELGSGGMATVYRARDLELGREVAIKIMHPHLAKREEHAERFRREGRAVARLRHRHIIEIYDFVRLEDDGDGTSYTFMVSELVEGPSLADFLKDHSPLLPEVAALIAAKVGEALTAAHAAGMVHRDVKPENVLIAPGGRVVLTDFGIARVLDVETVTATGALIGSPSYMSPEQAKGLRPRSGSDCFSLGVMLYRMATGRLPFPGRDPITVISAILKGRFTPPLQAAPAVGTTLDRLIVACLEPDADLRTSSAEDLADSLLDFAAEGGLTDPDVELERFFAAPEQYQQSATRRIVATLVERVDDPSADLSMAASLALCDRILSLDPDNQEALRIMQAVGRRRSRSKALYSVGIALGVLLLLGLTWGIWHFGQGGDGSKDGGDRRGRAGAGEDVVGDGGSGDGGRGDGGSGLDGSGVAGEDPDAQARMVASGDAGIRNKNGANINVGAAMHSGRRRRRRRPGGAGELPMAMAMDTAMDRSGRDAGVHAIGRGADAAAGPPARKTGPGRLQVLVMPFCNIRVDGRPYGRSPMPKPRSISAGSHRVTCRHPISGKTFSKTVRVASGQLTRIRDSLFSLTRVTVRLSRSTSIIIGTATYRSGATSIPPGRQPYRLMQGQNLLVQGWLSIPPGRCTLVDSPTPRCR